MLGHSIKTMLAAALSKTALSDALIVGQRRLRGNAFVRAVNYHGTIPAHAQQLERQLAFLAKHFRGVGLTELLALLDRAVAAPTLAAAAPLVGEVDRLLHGVPGVLALVGRSELIAGIGARLDQLDGRIADLEGSLDATTLSCAMMSLSRRSIRSEATDHVASKTLC